MKRITKITVLALGLVLVAGQAGVMPRLAELQPSVQAANRHVFTLDLAVDCRTGVTEFNRGAASSSTASSSLPGRFRPEQLPTIPPNLSTESRLSAIGSCADNTLCRYRYYRTTLPSSTVQHPATSAPRTLSSTRVEPR